MGKTGEMFYKALEIEQQATCSLFCIELLRDSSQERETLYLWISSLCFCIFRAIRD